MSFERFATTRTYINNDGYRGFPQLMSKRWRTLLLKSLFGIGLLLVCQMAEAKGSNTISKIDIKEQGSKTVVRLRCTTKPMFSVFKLERPQRLTVDVANARLAQVASLIDVDSWAVSQVGTTQFRTSAAVISRIMINFRRKAHYTVKTEGFTVVVTIIPHKNKVYLSKDKASARAIAQAQKEAKEARYAANTAKKAEAQAKADLIRLRQEAEQAKKKAIAAEGAVTSVKSKMAKLSKTARRVHQMEQKANHLSALAEQARLEAERSKMEIAVATRKLSQLRRDANRAKEIEARATALGKEAKRAKAAEKRAKAEAAQARQLVARLQKDAEQARSQANQERKNAKQKAVELRKAQAAAKKLSNELNRAQVQAEHEKNRVAKLEGLVKNYRGSNGKNMGKRLRKTLSALMKAKEDARKAEQSRLVIATKLQRAQQESKRKELARKRAEAAKVAAERVALGEKEKRQKAEHARYKATQRAKALQAAIARFDRKKGDVVRISTRLKTLENALADASRREANLKRKIKETHALNQTLAAQAKADRKIQRRSDAYIAELKKELRKGRVEAASVNKEIKRLTKEVALANQRSGDESSIISKLSAAKRRQKELTNRHQTLVAKINSALTGQKKALKRLKAAETKLAKTQNELRMTKAALRKAEVDKNTDERARRLAKKQRTFAERKLRKAAIARAKAENANIQAQYKLRNIKLAPKAQFAANQRGDNQLKWKKTKVSVATSVRNISFADKANRSEVQIRFVGNIRQKVYRQGDDIVMVLENANLPKLLHRTLDTTAFNSPIRSISSFTTNGKDAVYIKVNAKNGAKQRLKRKDDLLVWEFDKNNAAFAASPEALKQNAKANDAYAYQTVRVAGSKTSRRKGSRYKRRSYTGRRIDLDFKDADIHNILRLLSQVGNINIVTSDDVRGKVTIRMRNVPWDQAMDVILRAKGLGQVREGNLVRVAPMADLEKEREAEIARRKQLAQLQPLETRLVPLSYADAKNVLAKLRYTLSPRGKLTFDDRTNMVIARDVSANLNLLEKMLRNLDTQTPQVMIEARIIEARSTYSKEIGIQWGGTYKASAANGNSTGLAFPNQVGIGGGVPLGDSPSNGLLFGQDANPNFAVNMPTSTNGGALGITLGSISGAFNINLRLSAAETKGDVRIVSSPRITTMDNVEATIEQGVSIPYSQVSAAGTQTIFQDAKLNLTVKPHVTADGSIIMNVSVERNEPQSVAGAAQPSISKKQAKTEMLVKDGDTAVIGGIYTTRDNRTWTKVPWFADIPILGWFFKSRSDTSEREEVLVFITPRIINRAQSIGR